MQLQLTLAKKLFWDDFFCTLVFQKFQNIKTFFSIGQNLELGLRTRIDILTDTDLVDIRVTKCRINVVLN